MLLVTPQIFKVWCAVENLNQKQDFISDCCQTRTESSDLIVFLPYQVTYYSV